MCEKINALKTVNGQLYKHLTAIDKLEKNAVKAVFEIAVRLNIINTEKLFDGTEYKSICELSAACFGYSRSTTMNYIKIAREYLDVKQDGGKMRYTTICAREDGTDYRIGQLNALGKTSAEDFRMLDADGTISPSMSADEIRKAVKAFYEPEPDEPDETPEPPAEDTEQENEPVYDPAELALNHVRTAADHIAHAGEYFAGMEIEPFCKRIADAITDFFKALEECEKNCNGDAE